PNKPRVPSTRAVRVMGWKPGVPSTRAVRVMGWKPGFAWLGRRPAANHTSRPGGVEQAFMPAGQAYTGAALAAEAGRENALVHFRLSSAGTSLTPGRIFTEVLNFLKFENSSSCSMASFFSKVIRALPLM